MRIYESYDCSKNQQKVQYILKTTTELYNEKNISKNVYDTIFSLLEHSDIKAVIFYINLALRPLVNIKIYLFVTPKTEI